MNSAARPSRPFDFARDTFAFANELVWEYELDSAGTMKTRRREPPPTFAHHCFVLVRAARQFWLHAAFDPAGPRDDEAVLGGKIRAVLRRSPLRRCRADEVITFRGFGSLRALSATEERLMKRMCHGPWRSYVLRSHWRMVFPISRRHQEQTAGRVAARLEEGWAPIVHLVRFPQLTINHGVLLMAGAPTDNGLDLLAYDPNQIEQPARLHYDARRRTFFLPANRYWAGGRVDVIEIYRSILF